MTIWESDQSIDTQRTGEPFTGGSGRRQVTRSGATRAPCKGRDSPLCKERMKLTVETDLERIAAKCCESSVEERGAGKLHATFCGNRGRAIAPGDPVAGVQFPCATRLATDRRQETVEPARIGKARSRSR